MTEERRGSMVRFASDFPQAPELDALVDAFAAGDFARVREEGARLARSTDDAAVRKAAETLVERTRPDPLAVGLLVVTGVLLVAMTGYWVAHGRAPPGSAPTKPLIERPATIGGIR